MRDTNKLVQTGAPGTLTQIAGPWKSASPGCNSDCAGWRRASSHTSILEAPAASATSAMSNSASRPRVRCDARAAASEEAAGHGSCCVWSVDTCAQVRTMSQCRHYVVLQSVLLQMPWEGLSQ